MKDVTDDARSVSAIKTSDILPGWLDRIFAGARRVLLNDSRTLARLNFNGQNDLVFSYIYENPYRVITLDEIEANATREPLRKNLHEFVRAFGFSGTLRQLFFDVSKRSIYFRREIIESGIPLNLYWVLQDPTMKFDEAF